MTLQQPIHIQVSEAKVIKSLFITVFTIEILLVLLDVFVNYGKFTDIGALRRLCNIAREDGMATWFASTQTLLAGLTAFLVYIISAKLNKATLGWLVTALFFIYMAFDDGAQIHERVGTAFKVIASREDGGILYWILNISPSYPWQLVFVPIFGGIGLYMSYFLWRELRVSGSRGFMMLAFACMAIAVGLDFIEGLEKKHPWNIYTLIRDYYEVRSYTVWHFAKVAEEFLEMFAISLFWLVYTKHLFYLLKPCGVKVDLSS